MRHKYLEDINAIEELPSEWLKGDKRESKWAEQREIYGFDDRETWSLDATFFTWLYERLMMYNEVNIIDTSFHRVEYEGETYTFQECINKMLDGCKTYLTDDYYELEPTKIKKVEDVPNLFALCIWLLWW